MSAGGASYQPSNACPAADGRVALKPGKPVIDIFQTTFAAYLAGNIRFDRLRKVMVACVRDKPQLIKVVASSFEAAFASHCISLVDYRVLQADLKRLRVASARPANRKKPRKSIGPGSILRRRFEIVERVAMGGVGVLYRAIDRQRRDSGTSPGTVAIKMLADEFRHSPHALRSLRCEAHNAQYLSHSNIRSVYDLDQCDAGMFIAMEWVEGESLATRLDRTRTRAMPPPAAIRVLTGVGSGLTHAHEMGIVHGDVKPGNVFVTVNGTIKLLDFGQANAVSDVPRPVGQLSISPGYASCELHEGGRPEIRDDVFALAVMAYRILAGARPFGRHTPLAAERAGIRALRPVGMSKAQWRVLQQGLAWRRERRPPNVAGFVAELLAKQSIQKRDRPASLQVAAILGLTPNAL